MKDELKNDVLELISSNSNNLLISLRNEEMVQINAIMFSQILKGIGKEQSRDIRKCRRIKQAVLDLIDDGEIIMLNGEPPFYFLRGEFQKKIKSKNNITGIEGFIK